VHTLKCEDDFVSQNPRTDAGCELLTQNKPTLCCLVFFGLAGSVALMWTKQREVDRESGTFKAGKAIFAIMGLVVVIAAAACVFSCVTSTARRRGEDCCYQAHWCGGCFAGPKGMQAGSAVLARRVARDKFRAVTRARQEASVKKFMARRKADNRQITDV
jgi:hypothetical protein